MGQLYKHFHNFLAHEHKSHVHLEYTQQTNNTIFTTTVHEESHGIRIGHVRRTALRYHLQCKETRGGGGERGRKNKTKYEKRHCRRLCVYE